MTERAIPAWLPFALLILAVAALFPGVLAGEALFWGLPSLQFYPWREYAFAQIAAGRLPVWNPLVGAGAPLLANYQTAVFYPPNWLHLVLPDAHAMSILAVLHVLWAGLGMWLFAGALGLSAFGRGFSTLAYALSGYLIGRAGSFPTADAAAWIPWMFWLAWRAVNGGRWRDAGGLALVFALQLLAGHAQTTWYSTVAVGLFALWIALWLRRSEPARWRARALLLAGLGMLLGAGIAAIQLVPTAEYLLESQRSGGLDYATLTNLSYHPLRLVTWLNPRFFGSPVDGSYLTKGKGAFFEDHAYIGFLPVIAAGAAVVGWLRLRRKPPGDLAFRTIPFWAGLALLGLFFAGGRHNPLFRPLVDAVPTFDAFRDPVRWLILPVFGLSVLAGIGTEHWGRGKWIVFWSRLAGAGGAALALMALGYVTFSDPEPDTLRVLSWSMAELGCWIAVAALLTLIKPDEATGTSPGLWRVAVLIFVAVDLVWAGAGLNPTVPPAYYTGDYAVARPAGRIYWFEDYEDDVTFGSDEDAPNPLPGYFNLSDYRIAQEDWRAVRTSLLPNLTMLDGIHTLNNNDPLLPAGYSRYIALIEALGPAAGSLLRAGGVSQVYGLTPDGWQGGNPATAPDDPLTAWLVPDAVWLDSDAAVEDALRDPAWDPDRTAVLHGERSAGDSAPPLTAGSASLIDESPTRLVYRVQADGAGFLALSRAWYPGWRAEIDGQPVDLFRANLAFMAVAVPPGESTITLSYSLNHWRAGAAVSGIALAIAAGLILWDQARRSRQAKAGATDG